MGALVLGSAGRARAQIYEFTTLAGNAGYQSGDGVGKNARFLNPEGVAVDGSGNVYVADYGNNTIRKITPAGVVTTLAGKAGYAVSDDGLGSMGSADGVGSAARFSAPWSVAVNSSGDVFVADRDNSTIRKIAASGVVTTFAGTAGSRGGADGIGSAARFSSPFGVAVDGGGTLYGADFFNGTIRKITPEGVVTTLAGSAGNLASADGTGSAARFAGPRALAVDASGNVFVADVGSDINGGHPIFFGCTIRRVTPAGVVTTLAGVASGAGAVGSVDGVGTAARFNIPSGIAVDSGGNIYVGDSGNDTIRKISAGSVVTTFAGRAGNRGSTDGIGGAAQFSSPAGLAIDSGGNVFVADTLNNVIRKITVGAIVTTLAGNADLGTNNSTNLDIDGVGSTARFALPTGVAADSGGNLFVTDGANHKIRKVSASGVVTTLAVSDGGGNNTAGLFLTLFSPNGVALDGSGNLLISDGSAIRKITAAGVATTLAGSIGPGSGIGSADGARSDARFFAPNGLAVDGSGNVFVADSGNRTVRKVTPTGVVTTLAGTAGTPGNADGTGSAAQFGSPSGVAVDGSGNVFVADRDNYTIRKITAGGIVTTLAGLGGSQGGADGVGSAARFMGPEGIAVGNDGNLFVADGTTIRRITASGIVTTIGGKAANRDSMDATGSTARFGDANALAVDVTGNIYVTDSGFKTIRKGVPLANPARLVNVSVLAAIAGGDSLTMGTIIGGVGTSVTKPLLVRVAGPSLAPFGVTSLLADPKFEFFTDTTKVNENDDWGGAASVSAVFAQVGAFPFVAQTSKDAALYFPAVAPGNNSVRVSGTGNADGAVLAELYDATPAAALTPATPRLINVSVLKNVGSGLTAGFIVNGQGTETVLIRDVGPSLAVFGVGGLLADPKLELFNGQSQSIATNDNWGDAGVLAAATLSAAFTQVGAFVLSGTASKDAALLVTLMPGNYTVQVRSADGTTGVALVEVYEVP